MKSLAKTVSLFLGLFLLLLFCGCSTSSWIVNSWRENDYPRGTLLRVLVFADYGELEIQERIEMEKEMVEALTNCGVEAYSCYDLLGPQSFTYNGKLEMLKEMLREKRYSFTSVLFINRIYYQRKEIQLPVTVRDNYRTTSSYTDNYYTAPEGSKNRETYTRTITVAYPKKHFVRYYYTYRISQYGLRNDELVYYLQMDSQSNSLRRFSVSAFCDKMIGDMDAKGILLRPPKPRKEYSPLF